MKPTTTVWDPDRLLAFKKIHSSHLEEGERQAIHPPRMPFRLAAEEEINHMN